jgi:hypothetical protein
MENEIINASEIQYASIIRGANIYTEEMKAKGQYFAQCFDKYGNLKWEDTIDNVVTTLGKNFLLDRALAGSSYSAVGPFMGLISSVSYTGVPVAADTMASHATWYEVSATTYFPTVAARLTCNGGWNSAGSGSKALTSALSFSIITNAGTVKGCFLVTDTGAVATLGSAAGTLYSAGVFTGGDKAVGVGDTLQVSYTATLT